MKATILGFVLAIVLTASGFSARATTHVVRPDGGGDSPDIQAAIDAATDGDIVELTDGTFTGDGNRDIDYKGKALTVRSQSGNPEGCIIDHRLPVSGERQSRLARRRDRQRGVLPHDQPLRIRRQLGQEGRSDTWARRDRAYHRLHV
jgi:hypothetical protein